MTGCETDGNGVIGPEERELRQSLSFSARVGGTTGTGTIGSTAGTRVTDSRWDEGDMIGVYMTDATTDALLAANKRYHTPANGIFNAFATDDRIVLPEGATVDLYAYYPHSPHASGFSIPVDISDQSDQGRLDVMHASLAGVSDFSPPPTFYFTRQTVRLVFNVSAGQGISSLGGLGARVSGVPTRATFDVARGAMTIDHDPAAPFAANVTSTGTTSAKVEVTLLPDNISTPVVTFTLDGSPFEWRADRTFEAGGRYTYDITLTDRNGTTTPANKYFDTPLLPTYGPPTTLLYVDKKLPGSRSHMRNFQMLFDTQEHIALWVSYPMHPGYTGSSGRSDDWGYDPDVPRDQQANLSGGWGGSGYDRGHQIPSADRTYSRTENATTFYYTNMTPQNSTLNQGQWATLEGKVRDWMNGCDTLYVVTGAVLPPVGQRQYLNDRSGRPMAIPQYYYKALAKRFNNTNRFETVAFKVDNRAPSGASATWSSWRITVAELEQATGITFFPQLPDPSVKNSVSADQWR